MSKSSTQKTENAPPKWAEPLLKAGAAAGMDLYNRGVGYQPYQGATRAGFSDLSLDAMNKALQATGYQGSAVTNDSWKNTPAIQSAMQQIEQLKALKAQQLAPTQAPAEPQKRKEDFFMTKRVGGREGYETQVLKPGMEDEYRAWVQAQNAANKSGDNYR